MPAHQTIAKFGLGEPFGRPPTQKAGFWINKVTIYFLIRRRKPPHREFDLTVGKLAPTFKDRDVTPTDIRREFGAP
jgi:hypothetical protein